MFFFDFEVKYDLNKKGFVGFKTVNSYGLQYFLYDFRLPSVIVCHDYLGKRVFQVPPSTVIRYIKTLIYQETDYPVSQQQLFHNGKLVSWKLL